LLVAEGECVPGDLLHIGNTNSRLRFRSRAYSEADGEFDVATWMNGWAGQGPTHHVALGVGHVADQIRHFGRMRGLPCVTV
ncbi:MAG TPA: hypothetical protein VK934_12565, partial [Fimbriimonas sp.]|nr:hypothetical protein [Fimbriimonas sp.]